MDSNNKSILASIWIAGVIVIILFIALYKTDGSPAIATSSYTVEEIASAMEETEHIRFIEELGITPTGRVLFSYHWVDYGLFDAPQCFREDDAVQDALDIVDVKR